MHANTYARPDVLTLASIGSEESGGSSESAGVAADIPPPARPRGKLAPLSAAAPIETAPVETAPVEAALFTPVVPPASKPAAKANVRFAADVKAVVSDDSDDVQSLLQQRGVGAPRVGRLAPLRPITPHPAAINGDAHAVGTVDHSVFDF